MKQGSNTYWESEATYHRPFAALRRANLDRLRSTPKYAVCACWDAFQWAGAMAGEAGEAANVAKKLHIAEQTGRPNEERAELVAKLGKEIADVIIYCDLLAAEVGLDLWPIIVAKFNEVSERVGSDVKL